MADFKETQITDDVTDVIAQLNDKVNALAKQLDETNSNVKQGYIRFNGDQQRWERFNGSSWQKLANKYSINIDGRADTANYADTAGKVGGQNAADFVKKSGDTMTGDLTVTPTVNGLGRIKIQSTADHPNADYEARASNGGRARLFLSESDNYNFSIQYDSDDNSLKINREVDNTTSVTATIDRNSDQWHFKDTPTAGGNTIWHEGNTGKNSQLQAGEAGRADNADNADTADYASNADKLDGRSSSYFFPKHGGTVDGNLVVDNGANSKLTIANDGDGDAALSLAKSDAFGFVIYSDGGTNDLKFNRVSQGSGSTTAYIQRTADRWYFTVRPKFNGNEAYDKGNLFTGVYDKSANRSQNVTYTNTTGAPMFVTIDGSTDLKLIVDGTRIKNAQANAGGTDDDAIVSCIVPPGGNYKLTEGGFDHWTEVY